MTKSELELAYEKLYGVDNEYSKSLKNAKELLIKMSQVNFIIGMDVELSKIGINIHNNDGTYKDASDILSEFQEYSDKRQKAEYIELLKNIVEILIKSNDIGKLKTIDEARKICEGYVPSFYFNHYHEVDENKTYNLTVERKNLLHGYKVDESFQKVTQSDLKTGVSVIRYVDGAWNNFKIKLTEDK